MFAGNAGLWAGRGVIGPITCGWELDAWVSWEKPFSRVGGLQPQVMVFAGPYWSGHWSAVD